MLQSAVETATGAIETVASAAEEALSSAWEKAKETGGSFGRYLADRVGGGTSPSRGGTEVASLDGDISSFVPKIVESKLKQRLCK